MHPLALFQNKLLANLRSEMKLLTSILAAVTALLITLASDASAAPLALDLSDPASPSMPLDQDLNESNAVPDLIVPRHRRVCPPGYEHHKGAPPGWCYTCKAGSQCLQARDFDEGDLISD